MPLARKHQIDLHQTPQLLETQLLENAATGHPQKRSYWTPTKNLRISYA